MTSSIKLPGVPTELVTTEAGVKSLCEHLRGSGRFAFDTEFIGENNYQPILCLVQVATEGRVELIDPIAVGREEMRPLWELLADPAVEKICHAGDQDVEIAWLHSGLVTRNMFDTQIGAGMMGVAYPTALWRVVEYFTGITLEKAHTYSAWDRRPLSKAQFAYAIDDVRYLPLIHAEMKRRIETAGHFSWMAAACDEMCEDSARPSDARKVFVKLRGASGLRGDQLSVLREVAALREQLAFEHDVPPRSLLKDEPLLDIAMRMPAKESALIAIRDVPQLLIESYGDEIVEAVARGLATPETERPSMRQPPEDAAEVKRLAETLWVAAQVICLGQGVTPAVVTSQNEVLAMARLLHRKVGIETHPLMSGWHRECLGDKLMAFSRGKLQVDLMMKEEQMVGTFQAKG